MESSSHGGVLLVEVVVVKRILQVLAFALRISQSVVHYSVADANANALQSPAGTTDGGDVSVLVLLIAVILWSDRIDVQYTIGNKAPCGFKV